MTNRFTYIVLPLLAGASLGFIGGSFLVRSSKVTQETALKCVGYNEVSDLIARLKTVAKGKYEWSPGVQVTFYGDKKVTVELEIDANNQYTGTAPTLREAVDRITRPSIDVQRALEGWGK